eukprot:CAMPEP_0197246016 /NCGR_PEP_ID=MMETSP1429-20130617/10611_1 /TAXON_ID=49237 /ORGANISM="Chaetoceros  sp., Strain UNC1202" /LENGTH=211 /DNA_ID=CAMNT_0042706609 /DNA_START=156 /DNA_END=791 /DNA_ORIENTATION=+
MNQLRLLVGDGRLSGSRNSWQSTEIIGDIERGAAMMELLRLYVETYSSQEDNKIAIELSERLLDLDCGRAELPSWLINSMLGSGNVENNGLFAKSGGDPTALLKLYMKHGLYVKACELICHIVRGKGNDRDQQAVSRLPEKGNIDFLPYDAIDRLWNLIESQLRSSGVSRCKRQKLLDGRMDMEAALEKHFKLMQASEIGMLSARVVGSRA